MSRLPVREGLRELTAEGLIDHEHNLGFTVARLSRDDFRQVYLMRRLLEAEVLRSLEPAGEHLLAQLADLNGRIEVAGSAQDFASARTLNKEFHFAIFSLSPLKLLVREIERIWGRAMPYQLVTLHDPTSRQRVLDEHRAMIAALRAGRLDEVVTLMNQHRDGSEVQLSVMLQAGQPPGPA